LLEKANKQGSWALKRLEEMKTRSSIVGDVRGKGLMIGVELVENCETKKPAPQKASTVIQRTWKRGVALITCGASTLRIAPPLTINRDLLEISLDIVEDAILEVEKEA
jgi:4-aminobutyrate aminotransferase